MDSQVSNAIFLKALLGKQTYRPPCCWVTAGEAVCARLGGQTQVSASWWLADFWPH